VSPYSYFLEYCQRGLTGKIVLQDACKGRIHFEPFLRIRVFQSASLQSGCIFHLTCSVEFKFDQLKLSSVSSSEAPQWLFCCLWIELQNSFDYCFVSHSHGKAAKVVLLFVLHVTTSYVIICISVRDQVIIS